MSEFEKIKKKVSGILSTTAVDLFYALSEFGKKYNIKDEVTVHLLDDQLKMTDSDTCGMFQIYFYVNLFKLLEHSQLINNKKLNKKTIEAILNEIFTLDKQENENRVERFAKENDISREYVVVPSTIFFYKKLLPLDSIL